MKQLLILAFILVGLLASAPAVVAREAPPADSLFRALRTAPNDTARVKLLRLLTRSASSDSVLYYANLTRKAVAKALPKANASEKRVLLYSKADVLEDLASAYEEQSDLPQAVNCFEEAVAIYRQIGAEKEEGGALVKMAGDYQELGNVNRAMTALERGLRLSRKHKHHIAISKGLVTLGNLNAYQGDTATALNNYYEALEEARKSGNKDFEIGVQLNTIFYLMLDGKYDEASQQLHQILEFGKQVGSHEIQAFAYKDMADIAKRRKDYKEAFRLYSLGLSSARAYGNIPVECNLYGKLGTMSYEQGDYVKGIYYATKAKNLAEKSRIIRLRQLTADLLSRLHEKNGQPALALQHYRQSVILRDSLQNAKNHEALVKQQYQSDYEQKEALLKAEQDKKQALAKQEIEKQQFQRNAMLGGALMLLLLLGLLYNRYRLKQRKNQELEVAYTDLERTKNELLQKEKALFAKQVLELELKALRAQMNPHFIFNCLNAIQAIILSEDKKTATEYLQKFSRLIRLILDNSRKESTTLEDETEILTLYLDLEQLRMSNKFDYEIDIPDEVESAFTDFPSMIIQPIVENSIWHGLMPSEQQGHLRISFRRDEDLLTCVVEDNGIGRQRSQELKGYSTHDSKGLKLIEERLQAWSKNRELDCKIRVLDASTYGSGTRTEITIQYAAVYA